MSLHASGTTKQRKPSPGKSWFRRLADWEEGKWNDLIERAAEKQPEAFWNDDVPNKGWELWLMDHWPAKLTIGYWYYLLANLRGGHSGGWVSERWINRPYPINDIEEWKYFFKNFHWFQLFEQTKTERLICRFKNHPEGEVYYNPGGDEPDHHCKTCGENIG